MSSFFVVILNSYFLILTSLSPIFSQAQSLTEEPLPIRAVISGPREVAVGKTIVLDASLSSADPATVSYLWTREGDVVSRTAEAVLTLDQPGTYEIALTVRDRLTGRGREAKITQQLHVFRRKILLLAGPEVPEDKLVLHKQSGEERGVFLDILQVAERAVPLGLEDAMTQLITENSERLRGAEAIVLWSEGPHALNALTRAFREDPERRALLATQSIVLITERGLQTLARVVRGPFSVLDPQRIVLTRKEATNPLLEAENVEQFLTEIEQRDIDFLVLSEDAFAVRPWNLLTTLVTFMITHGVSSEMVVLLLMLPFILTLVAFLKQVVGIETFGLYTPAVITLSLVALGWQLGLLLLIIILIAGYLTRALMSRHHLLYIPKIAIILTTISIVLLVVLAIAALLGITFAPDAIFILLIMTTLSEEFMSVKAELGLRSALVAVSETVLVSLLCFSLVVWPPLQAILLAYPELVLLTILVNIILGRYTGLRIAEVVRFREVFRHLEE